MCLGDRLALELYGTFKYYMLCSLYDLVYLVAHVYCGVCHTLLGVYDSPTGSETTNHKDISILASSLELKNREREAFRRLRMRRLPVILKFAFTVGVKILANAACDGGSV